MTKALAWPLAPVLGQIFSRFAYNGRSWVRARGAEWTVVQRFIASGFYNPSPDLLYAVVECWGAGGGGGWTRTSTQLVPNAGAGGGGSGGYSRITLQAEVLVGPIPVTVAPGAQLSTASAGGGFAGDTMFGNFCTARGGGNAYGFDGTATLSAFGAPGLGAPVGIGHVAMPGVLGGQWLTATVQLNSQDFQVWQGGFGGTLLGGNQMPNQLTWIGGGNAGVSGLPNTGAGGGGASSNGDSPNFTRVGGQGGSGLVMVTEVCGEPNGGGPSPWPPEPGPGPEEPERPPGVPIRIDARVKLVEVPYDCDPVKR